MPNLLNSRVSLISLTLILLCTACGGGSTSNSSSTSKDPAPTLNLTSDKNTAYAGQATKLTWNSAYATSCTASGAWNGVKTTSGSIEIATTQLGKAQYQLYCVGTGGNVSQTVEIQISTPPVELIAGQTGGVGYLDGKLSEARVFSPHGIVKDSKGNIFFADTNNNVIRKITPDGLVSTFAGTLNSYGLKDGTGATASFSFPIGLAIDKSDVLYVADSENHAIRKILPSAVVTTLAGNGVSGYADGDASNKLARFNMPRGLYVDALENIYVADTANNAIRKISKEGKTSTIAGHPNECGFVNNREIPGDFCLPIDIFADNSGSIFVAVAKRSAIKKISSAGVISTLLEQPEPGYRIRYLTGDELGNIYFTNPSTGAVEQLSKNGQKIIIANKVNALGLFLDKDNSLLFSTSTSLNKLSMSGISTPILGSSMPWESIDGQGSSAKFAPANGMATDTRGNIYLVETDQHVIRKISSTGVVTTFAGQTGIKGNKDGLGGAALFSSPNDVATDAMDNVYIADTSNGSIRKITPEGQVSTIVKSIYYPTRLTVDGGGNIYVDEGNHILKINSQGEKIASIGNDTGETAAYAWDGKWQYANFLEINAMKADKRGNVYVSDKNMIRVIQPDGQVVTIAGSQRGDVGFVNGTLSTPRFFGLTYLAIDDAGNVYVADFGNRMIRKLSTDGVVSTVAGSLGISTLNPFSLNEMPHISGMAFNSDGKLYVFMDHGVFRLNF